MIRKNRRQSAFTLIELLVVVAIIGLLATISLVALNSARSRARDSRRVADIKSLVTALNLYYDRYGYYPVEPAREVSTQANFLAALVSEGFMAKVPNDPISDKGSHQYYYDVANYSSNGRCIGAQQYLLFFLEKNTDLSGFAFASGLQNDTDGYGRVVCLY